jgi:hypothetical protein
LTSTAAPILEALSDRAETDAAVDLSMNQCGSGGHIIIGPTGQQCIILRDAHSACTLLLHGSRASRAPVNVTFLVRGVPDPHRLAAGFRRLAGLLHSPQRRAQRSRERLFMRDALVALDGRSAGATYRDTAAVIYGAERARAAWSSASTAMKERMRHALARGQQFRDGAYRQLLE